MNSLRKLFVAIIFFLNGSAFAQLLDKKIDLEVSNSLLVDVLKNIEQNQQIDFSFNSSLIPPDCRVSISAKEQSLEHILDHLTKELPISYKEINNQIVLVKTRASVVPKKMDDDLSPRNTPIDNRTAIFETKFVYDTVIEIRYDTITTLNFDTLIVVDTIRLFDTLRVVERIAQPEKFFFKTYYAPVFYTRRSSLNEDEESSITDITSKYSFQFGVAFGLIQPWGCVSIGLQLSEYNDNVSAFIPALIKSVEKENLTVRSEKIVDSTFLYFTYPNPEIGTDTTSVYHYDTSYVTVTDTNYTTHYDTVAPEKNSKLQRSLQYFSIPIFYSYPVSIGTKIVVSPTIGLRYSYLLYKDILQTDDQFTIQQEYSSHIFDGVVGLGFEYYVIHNFSVYCLPMYTQSLVALYRFPSTPPVYVSTFSVQFGFSYKF